MADNGHKRQDKLAKTMVTREEHLRSGERNELDSLFQQIARYTFPRKATFLDQVSPGVERNRFVLDSTAGRSLELFASFLHTLLNNPSVQWIKLRVKSNEELNKQTDVKQWLEAAAKAVLDILTSEDGNIYSHLHEVYLDLGAFGTAILYIDVVNGRFRVQAYHLNDCVIDENSRGVIDTMFRTELFRPRQAKELFGDQPLGKSIDDNKKNEPVEFMHCVFPMTDKELSEGLPVAVRNNGAPFAQVWINKRDRVTVKKSVYEEFPYMVPRWYRMRGSRYGRSPAMTALPDIRMSNRMMETILRGAEKLVDPPLFIPDGGLASPVRLFPGGLTFGERNSEPKPIIPPGASRIEFGDQLLKDRQQAIRDAFFVNLFATPESPVKTATQVLQEFDERNRAVSPMIIRTQDELFHKMVTRSFNVADRAGLLPEPPSALDEEVIGIEFVSPLSSSQREQEALGTLRLIETVLPWAQIDPGIFDPFDFDEVAIVAHGGSGAPASIMRDEGDIKKLREARQAQQEQEAEFQRLLASGEVAAKLGAAQPKGQRRGD